MVFLTFKIIKITVQVLTDWYIFFLFINIIILNLNVFELCILFYNLYYYTTPIVSGL